MNSEAETATISGVVNARSKGHRMKKKMENEDEDDLLAVNEPSVKRSGSKRKKKSSKSQPYPSSKRRGSFRRFAGDEDDADNEGK